MQGVPGLYYYWPLLTVLNSITGLGLTFSFDGPNANDISGMFIEPVINCLGHVHQKVRIVAACALGVLCNGDYDKGICKNSFKMRRANITNIAENIMALWKMGDI